MSMGSDVRAEVARRLQQTWSNHPPRFSSHIVPYLLSTADALVILLACLIGAVVYQLAVGNEVPNVPPLCAVGLLAGFIHILRISGSGYYDFPDSAKPGVEVGAILVCWFTTGLLLAFFAFLLKVGVDYSRGAFVLFNFLAPIGLLAVRKATKAVLQKAIAQGTVGRNDVVLIGDVNELAALEPRDFLAFFGASEVNRFGLSQEADASARASSDVRVLDSVRNFARRYSSREVVLALRWADAERIEFVREQLKTLPVAVRLLPDIRVRMLSSYASSARQRVLALEIQRAPLSSAERSVKRVMDVAIAVPALMFFAPVMLLTAIAIKLDSSGPIIFKQYRKGFNGKPFVMFKFRTMTVQENGDSVVQATRTDPRVTPMGALLRSASIDELPQLLNVLIGNMSLIGPRPHALAHDTYFEKVLGEYAFRHHVKPGMTGWAQCHGARGPTPTLDHIAKRVKLDLWYVNNWSLWLDIQILIKTFFEVLRKRNAY
jgi:Undecaprenyl-phosphate glucose phosphotransferase